MLEVSVVRAILKKLIVICLVSVITSLLSLSLIGKIGQLTQVHGKFMLESNI